LGCTSGTPSPRAWAKQTFDRTNRVLRHKSASGSTTLKKIFVYVTVVQQVMAVEQEEDSGALYHTALRLVHAPVQILKGRVITTGGEEGTQ